MAALPPSSGSAADYPPQAPTMSGAVPSSSGPIPNYPSQAPSFPPPPGSMPSFPGPPVPQATVPPGPTTAPLLEQMPGPAVASLHLETNGKDGLKEVRSTTEFALRELLALQRRRYSSEVGVEERLRGQAGAVLSDLRVLRRNLSDVVKEAENHRWRRWLLGGALGAIIPAMRAIFRRPKEDVEASNDTEYAFGKSKSLLRRIVDSVGGTGGLASFTFIVFAVLYVFSNEVSLRVAKAVGKRLKRLSAKVERQEELTEKDLEVFGGWRWRVLLWSS